MKLDPPKAIMLDLDDTIVAFDILQEKCWNTVLNEYAPEVGERNTEMLAARIREESRLFWSDVEKHRLWRQNLDLARRHIVEKAFRGAGLDGDGLSERLADRYSVVREEAIYPFPGAIDTIRKFRELRISLALVTNGSAESQRRKIERFDIGQLFDHILIEGEQGFGKPDERIYRKALADLGSEASDTWMMGDNLLWDVIAPQRVGIRGIWVNVRGIRKRTDDVPFLTIGSLSEILDYI